MTLIQKQQHGPWPRAESKTVELHPGPTATQNGVGVFHHLTHKLFAFSERRQKKPVNELDLDTLQQSGCNIYSQASLSAVLIMMKGVQHNTNKRCTPTRTPVSKIKPQASHSPLVL